MKLVFWFDNPPRVSKGAFNEISKTWNDDVYYFWMFETRDERKIINWDEGGYGNAKTKAVGDLKSEERIKLINELKDEIHIFCGYRGGCSQYLDLLISINKNPNLIIWAERPGIYTNNAIIKRIFLALFHSYYAKKYNRYTKAFIPLGYLGVKQYIKYGWDKNKIFEYGYFPPTTQTSIVKTEVDSKQIKLIYLGRFSNSKGLVTLMKAIDKVQSDNFTLDLVGGYGDLKNEVETWANRYDHINVLPSWPIDKAKQNLQKYDVCIIPSGFDGWNVTLNLSMLAYTGVIITDKAGSDGIITNSNAGIVVKANDVDELKQAIEKVLNDPDLVIKWSKNAQSFEQNITSKTAAKYFIDVINYAIFNKNDIRPQVPWEKQ